MDFFRALTPLWMSLNDKHCNALSMNRATLEAKNIPFFSWRHLTRHNMQKLSFQKKNMIFRMLFHKLLSARLIVFKTNKQTKNTSGKKLKYHRVPEGGASRTSKGATDSPACHWAAVGHYSSGGWAGAESGHPSCKS